MASTTPMSQETLLAIHDEMCASSKATMIAKNNDYADPGEFDVFGNLDACEHLAICDTEEGILIRVLDKIKRLVTSCRRELQVQDEKALDSRLDVINYMVLMEAKVRARKLSDTMNAPATNTASKEAQTTRPVSDPKPLTA